MESKKSPLLTLKSRNDYLALKKSGKKIYTKVGLIFSFKPNCLGYSRLGWTVPKYAGNAVVRNKLKRYCRESARSSIDKLNALKLDVNIVFLNKGKDHYKNLRFNEIENAMDEFLYKYKRKF